MLFDCAYDFTLVPMNFEDLGLGPKTLKAVKETGYTEPTPIQASAIPHVLAARDVLGIAQTGTGKTASFTLPMIDILSRGRAKARMPRSLILEPTRELAAQVAENFETYGKYHKLSMALLIGGVAFGEQNRKLMQGVDVLIATPGRLLDHIERGNLLMNGVQLLVVDEADRMLDMGFIPDIERIFKMTPFTRQTLFFSATMPTEIQRIVDTFLHNPKRVEVTRPTDTADTIEQLLIKLDRNDARLKNEALRTIIDEHNVRNAIVFCNRKRDVDRVATFLKKAKYSASPIHGDLPQSVRTATLEKFKNGDVKLLIASDVAARGLDIPDVSHVLNYDVPMHPEDYIHRIGRTGRAGKKGHAITIATPGDAKALHGVQSLIGKDIPLSFGEKESQTAPAYTPKAEKATTSAPAEEKPRGRRRVRVRKPKTDMQNPVMDTPKVPSPESAPAPAQANSAAKTKENIKTADRKPKSRKNPKRSDSPPKESPSKSNLGFGNAIPNFFKREC
ncbi:MAG: DEAD/DEAH box helicase [Robiginitomaculum sp.]|nr:DEAD/DEAH box helicase [Robiginitomaculum sp.]